MALLRLDFVASFPLKGAAEVEDVTQAGVV